MKIKNISGFGLSYVCFGEQIVLGTVDSDQNISVELTLSNSRQLQIFTAQKDNLRFIPQNDYERSLIESAGFEVEENLTLIKADPVELPEGPVIPTPSATIVPTPIDESTPEDEEDDSEKSPLESDTEEAE